MELHAIERSYTPNKQNKECPCDKSPPLQWCSLHTDIRTIDSQSTSREDIHLTFTKQLIPTTLVFLVYYTWCGCHISIHMILLHDSGFKLFFQILRLPLVSIFHKLSLCISLCFCTEWSMERRVNDNCMRFGPRRSPRKQYQSKYWILIDGGVRGHVY